MSTLRLRAPTPSTSAYDIRSECTGCNAVEYHNASSANSATNAARAAQPAGVGPAVARRGGSGSGASNARSSMVLAIRPPRPSSLLAHQAGGPHNQHRDADDHHRHVLLARQGLAGDVEPCPVPDDPGEPP